RQRSGLSRTHAAGIPPVRRWNTADLCHAGHLPQISLDVASRRSPWLQEAQVRLLPERAAAAGTDRAEAEPAQDGRTTLGTSSARLPDGGGRRYLLWPDRSRRWPGNGTARLRGS